MMSFQITCIGDTRTVIRKKRERSDEGPGKSNQPNLKGRKIVIDDDFIKERGEAYQGDKLLQLARNAIVNTGHLPICYDEDAVQKVNHVFEFSLKGKDAKATDQYHSGRCWLFSGLNTFRHAVMEDFNIKNFEFSQVHLYFWDKIENCDRFLQEVINTVKEPLDHMKVDDTKHYDRQLFQMFEEPIGDGAYWNCFANLVDKYGLMPKSAMQETVNSADSDDMNNILKSRLREAACYIRKNYNTKSLGEIQEFRKKVMEQIYNIVVMFLGKPPETFDWAYHNSNDEPVIRRDLTPHSFKKLVMEKVKLSDDFVILGNYPVEDWPYYQTYEVQKDNNMVGGRTHKFINLPIRQLEKYTMKSIKRGQPVWFIGDVGRGFHPEKSALDETLIKTDMVFGEAAYQMNKGERFIYQESSGCHAMTFLGLNEKDGKPLEWQVENSWGYDDSDIPGEDGFLSASNQWFKDNVFEVVIKKKFLKRKIRRLLEEDAMQLKSMGSAAK
jgi:bleomycin hydrolase